MHEAYQPLSSPPEGAPTTEVRASEVRASEVASTEAFRPVMLATATLLAMGAGVSAVGLRRSNVGEGASEHEADARGAQAEAAGSDDAADS